MKITKIHALEILDSRGKPTIRTHVHLDNGQYYTASVPSGASTGIHEAVELRDDDAKRHHGQGVLMAVENVNKIIAPELVGLDVTDQKQIDQIMLDLDGSPNKAKLGANAILSVSMAVAVAAAKSQNMRLWDYLNKTFFASVKPNYPRLMVNVVNGGKHASWNFDIQEFMIMPNTNIPSDSTRIAAEVFATLGKLLKKKHLSTLVGDEGGYSPLLHSNSEVFAEIENAAKHAGYTNVQDYRFGIDAASSEFYVDGKYKLIKDNKTLSADDLIATYIDLQKKYHIESFEDGFEQDDWSAWKKFTALGKSHNFHVVGDDHLCTNPVRVKKSIAEHSANAVLVKVNQIGTLTETAQAINMAKDAGWAVAISHRSGETEDNFIADLAYACAAEFIKTGSMSRSDRLSKYNRLLEIEAGY